MNITREQISDLLLEIANKEIRTHTQLLKKNSWKSLVKVDTVRNEIREVHLINNSIF